MQNAPDENDAQSLFLWLRAFPQTTPGWSVGTYRYYWHSVVKKIPPDSGPGLSKGDKGLG
jgi:hypothetical protein